MKLRKINLNQYWKTLVALLLRSLDWNKYYQSADNIPCGRYFLGIAKDKRYFIVGDKNKVLNKRLDNYKLKSSLVSINETLIDSKDRQQRNLELIRLAKLECSLHMTRSLVAVMSYVNALMVSGIEQSKIEAKVAPIAAILKSYGITTNLRRNDKRLERAKSQLIAKSEDLRKEIKCTSGDLYKSFVSNLVQIEAEIGVKINKEIDSLNDYMIALDKLNTLRQKQEDGKRHK